MANPVSRLFERFSSRSRGKKIEILRDCLPLTGREKVLDIGSELDGRTKQLIEIHPVKANITAVNLMESHLERIKAAYPDVHTQVADARALPFPDKSFDLVYSNAVIEHVGSLEDQRAMAREVQRVAKSWFITTPNRWFPFEFHTRLPLVSWFPAKAMHGVSRLWAYNHVRRRYMSGLDFGDVRLMTAREMRKLFPNSTIAKCRITVWPETLIAIGPRSAILQRDSTSDRQQQRSA